MADEPEWSLGLAKPPAWRADAGIVRFENPWIRVVEHEAVAPTGVSTPYGAVRFKNRAIAVLPLDKDGCVTLVGQQRFVTGAYSWELPEGGAGKEEPPLEGAMRELREETGLVAEVWLEILRLDLSNSITDEEAVCFLAAELSFAERAPDPTEAIAVARTPFRVLMQAVDRGQVRDALTVATALRAHHMAVTGSLPAALARLVLA